MSDMDSRRLSSVSEEHPIYDINGVDERQIDDGFSIHALDF